MAVKDVVPHVEIRVYVTGDSAYTLSVLDTLESVLREYSPSELMVEVREAAEALEEDRVFFTPMVVIKDRFDPTRRTVIVGDLHERQALKDVLARFGVHPRRTHPT